MYTRVSAWTCRHVESADSVDEDPLPASKSHGAPPNSSRTDTSKVRNCVPPPQGLEQGDQRPKDPSHARLHGCMAQDAALASWRVSASEEDTIPPVTVYGHAAHRIVRLSTVETHDLQRQGPSPPHVPRSAVSTAYTRLTRLFAATPDVCK